MSTRMVALGDSIYAGVSGAGGWVTGNRRIPDMIASTANGLIGMYVKNITDIYNRVKDLYSKASPYFDQDVQLPELQVVKLNNPTDLLNRVVYQWTVSCIQRLQMVMNNVVGDFNDNDIIDEDIGDTPELKLWLPERLVVDDIYMLKLQNNFDECNELLDKLNNYAQEYMNY